MLTSCNMTAPWPTISYFIISLLNKIQSHHIFPITSTSGTPSHHKPVIVHIMPTSSPWLQSLLPQTITTLFTTVPSLHHKPVLRLHIMPTSSPWLQSLIPHPLWLHSDIRCSVPSHDTSSSHIVPYPWPKSLETTPPAISNLHKWECHLFCKYLIYLFSWKKC